MGMGQLEIRQIPELAAVHSTASFLKAAKPAMPRTAAN